MELKDYYMVYTEQDCPHCAATIDFLKDKEEPFVVTDMSNNPDLLQNVKNFMDHQTVPIVQYVKMVYVAEQEQWVAQPAMIGGFDDLKLFFEQSEQPEQTKQVEK